MQQRTALWIRKFSLDYSPEMPRKSCPPSILREASASWPRASSGDAEQFSPAWVQPKTHDKPRRSDTSVQANFKRDRGRLSCRARCTRQGESREKPAWREARTRPYAPSATSGNAPPKEKGKWFPHRKP